MAGVGAPQPEVELGAELDRDVEAAVGGATAPTLADSAAAAGTSEAQLAIDPRRQLNREQVGCHLKLDEYLGAV